MKFVLSIILTTLSILLSSDLYAQTEVLFDGKSFSGWEGDTQSTWRIENGTITAGSATKAAPRNEFLTTKNTYENFELNLKFKISKGEHLNAGVQFRTKRIPNHHEVSGYQADIAPEYDGHLYDESRRRRFLAQPSLKVLQKVQSSVPADGWQTYRIVANGNRIQLWQNGIATVDYVETDATIEKSGVIALQIHGQMKGTIAYRDITLKRLPSSKSSSSK